MNNDEAGALVGLIMWVLIIAVMISGTRALRKRAKQGAKPVSGNGPKWEQDEPYALSVDYDREDDL